MPKKGNAYLDGTVHVGKEVQTIQRYKLELYMWENVSPILTLIGMSYENKKILIFSATLEHFYKTQ